VTRLKLLRKAEARAQVVVRSRDWVLQTIHLDFLASEYSRLYRELMALPAPRGLNAKLRRQYKALLAAQAAPYLAKARQFGQKVTQLWNDDDIREALIRDDSRAKGPLHRLALRELRALARIAPASYKTELRRAMARPTAETVSTGELRRAMLNVRKDPFDTDSLETLKELERKAGHHAMVAFLEAKIGQFKTEKRP
jgi:hypothetical protein